MKTYRPLCAASPALDRGKVWHHIWTCMNESDGIKHSVSRRLTQPPVSVSPVWRSPASLSEHHSLWSRHPPLQTPVLDILDSPSCDIFLLWTRWCHFLLGQLPVQINPGMWRGARGAIFWGHAADKFTRSCSSDMSQSRQEARYSLKWQLSSHLAHSNCAL